MSGYKLADISGKDIRIFLHKSSVKGFFLKEKNRSNTPAEVKLLKKDGSILFCFVNIKNFNPRKGEIKVASFKDITALKQYEIEKKELTERLIRSEKMEVIGRLAGGVAHDLNNVLMGIVNYPDMIIMNIDKKKFVLSAVKKIKESGLKAAAIVEDLLTLTRRGISRIEIFNINDVTNKFFNSPEFEKASRKFPDIKLKLDLDSALRNIKGSVVHINSTLMNLVYNSMEAIKKKGIIKIVSRNIKSSGKLFGKKGDNYIMLSVSDNGVGMDENEREKIFEPFYTKKIMGRKGTGLGMSVIWGTVKDHNGFINIKSKKGKGTTFELFFPASDLPLADEEKVYDILSFKGKGERILVVDDDEYAKDIACQYLKKSNYQAESVSSGEEAVKLIKKKKFDLIILDMLMSPGMDGLDTFKKIQEIKPGLKTLIASGFSETSRVREVLETGLSKFVKKPYSYAKLMSSVQEIING
jgi:nitrogen-specific signal transduction histidine kinase/CheY-like chemotaxis protein